MISTKKKKLKYNASMGKVQYSLSPFIQLFLFFYFFCHLHGLQNKTVHEGRINGPRMFR